MRWNGRWGQPKRVTETFGRFLVSGGVNTVATFSIYLLLLNVFSYALSYSIAFVLGIVISYYLNRTFVFRTKGSAKTVILFPAVYLAQYLVGLGVVTVWIEVFRATEMLAPVAAGVITSALTFVLSDWVFAKQPHA